MMKRCGKDLIIRKSDKGKYKESKEHKKTKMAMKLLLLPILILFLLLAIPSYAEELVNYDKQDVRYLKADIDKDDIEEEISVVTGETDKGVVCIIIVKDGKETVKNTLWIGFEHSCNLALVEIWPNLEPFIGVDYGVGAHGHALSLFRYRELGINYHTLEKVLTVTSDRPSIQIKDVDGDGRKDIVAVERDYEANSLDDGYIMTYKYLDDGKWERASVYRTATKESMPEDWDKDKTGIEAFKKNLERFDMRNLSASLTSGRLHDYF